MTCEQIELQLPAYIDGAPENREPIAAHLETCAACQASAHAQRVVRTVLRARAAELAPTAPPGLRTRIIANSTRVPSLGWSGRWSAFGAAAMVVVIVGAALMPAATMRSTTLLAAQLALDHFKCFRIEGDGDGVPISKPQAETMLKQKYDLDVRVPAPMPEEHLELMAARRCLYGDGRAAHVMYRLNGEPVSLFVMPGLTRPAAELSVLGLDEVVWTEEDRTYMLIARGSGRAALSRVASHLRTEAK